MNQYRIKDNRGKYWLWYKHSHHFRYGEWVDTPQEATNVVTEKQLKGMVRDIFRTVKAYDEIRHTSINLNQIAQSTGIVIEEVIITETVLGKHPVVPNFDGCKVRIDFIETFKFTKRGKNAAGRNVEKA